MKGLLKDSQMHYKHPTPTRKEGEKKSEAVMRGWLYEGWGGDKVVRAGG